MKNLLKIFFVVSIMLCLFSTNSFAAFTHYHDIGVFQNKGIYGVQTTSTIPKVDSKWASDSAHNNNCVNFELWDNVYAASDGMQWVEMGYKEGRGYDSNHKPDTSWYKGFFVAVYKTDSSKNITYVYGTEYPNLSWAPTQTHTWSSSGSVSTGIQVNADGTLLETEKGLQGNSYRFVEAGVEVVNDPSVGAWNPLPSTSNDYMSNLKIWTGAQWSNWSAYTDPVVSDDSGDYCSITYDKSNNRLTFN